MDSLISSAQAVVQIWKAVSSCQITGLIIIISYVYIVLFIPQLPKVLYKLYIYKIVQPSLGWLVLVSRRSGWQLVTLAFLLHMKALGKTKRHDDGPASSHRDHAIISCDGELAPVSSPKLWNWWGGSITAALQPRSYFWVLVLFCDYSPPYPTVSLKKYLKSRFGSLGSKRSNFAWLLSKLYVWKVQVTWIQNSFIHFKKIQASIQILLLICFWWRLLGRPVLTCQ